MIQKIINCFKAIQRGKPISANGNEVIVNSNWNYKRCQAMIKAGKTFTVLLLRMDIYPTDYASLSPLLPLTFYQQQFDSQARW